MVVWPALPDLFPVRFHGVLTNRDAFLVDVDLDRLRDRVGHYFDPGLSHEEIERRYLPLPERDEVHGAV